MTRKNSRRAIAVLITVLISLFFTVSCRQPEQDVNDVSPPLTNIKIGSKGYTEQIILLKVLSVFLKENGYEVTEVPYMVSSVARAALEQAHIDLYWEYTGTALVMYHKQPPESNPRIAFETVKEIDRGHNLIWLNSSKLNSTYTILMRQDKAKELDIASISDLAVYVRQNRGQLLFASSPEFPGRDDGLRGLQKKYRFDLLPERVIKMDTGLLYNALKDDQVDVVAGIATDGRISRYGLLALKDDKSFFPAYNAAPVVRKELLDKHPELAGLINRIPELLDQETMMNLTYRADVEHEDITEIVREWLDMQQLI